MAGYNQSRFPYQKLECLIQNKPMFDLIVSLPPDPLIRLFARCLSNCLSGSLRFCSPRGQLGS